MFTALAVLSILWGLFVVYHAAVFWYYADGLRVFFIGVLPLILGVSYLTLGIY